MVEKAAEETSPASGYNSLFEQYIVAGVAHSLEAVEADRYRVPEEVRVQAWHLLSFALRTPQAWPVTANLLLALSPKMQQAGYREQWLAYLEQGLAYSQAAGDSQSSAALELEIGELLRHLGRLVQAEECFEHCLQIFQLMGDVLHAAAAKVCLANLACLREEWSLARTHCQEVLDTISEPHFVRARALFVAADAHAACHEDERARDLYCASQSIWQLLGEKRWDALCLQNQARIAARHEEYDRAQDLYGAALAVFIELDAVHSQAVVQMNWGIVEYYAGDLQKALALYQGAESIFRRLNDIRYLAMVCNNIGLVYLDSKQWQQAELYYQESISLFSQLEATLLRISVGVDLARLWLETGNAQRCAHYLDQLLAELQQTERNAEHRRLYREICDYSQRAALMPAAPAAGDNRIP